MMFKRLNSCRIDMMFKRLREGRTCENMPTDFYNGRMVKIFHGSMDGANSEETKCSRMR